MSTPRSGIEALQRAIVAALKTDAGVARLVAGRVFDEVPSDKDRPKPPYVYIGPINRRRIEGGSCVSARSVTFRLFVISTEFGRLDAWAVLDAVETALENKCLDLATPWSTGGDVVRVIQDGDVIQPLDPKATFADFTVTLLRTGD